MIRSIAALGLLLATTAAPFAQEATPVPMPPAAPAASQPAPPATPQDIQIDPAATIDSSPKQTNLLTGMYATQAIIELCGVTVAETVTAGMNADRKRLETTLAMDEATATTAYAAVKADVEKTTPDCADNSPDRQGVDAVIAIYAAQP